MRNWTNSLNRALFIFMALSSLLFAYNDSDFDGVADKHDLCPNSTMLDIVNKQGCTIETLIVPKDKLSHYDIIFGVNYTKMGQTDEKTFNQSLQLDYYHENITIQLQSTNFESAGLSDTVLGLFYRLKPMKKLSLSLGASVIFPTYKNELNNNNTDYKLSTSLNYQFDKSSLFLGASYTFINDDDIQKPNYTLQYKDAQNIYIGAGKYFFPTLYSSIIFNQSSNIYEDSEAMKSFSFYNHYIINKNWFSRFGYTHGLSKNSSDQLYLNIGYFF